MTAPMNSVGFLKDSNKLRISEPSMSFSLRGLFGLSEQRNGESGTVVGTRGHVHSQPVRHNGGCGPQGEGWRELQKGRGTQKQPSHRGEQGLWFGKSDRVSWVSGAG